PHAFSGGRGMSSQGQHGPIEADAILRPDSQRFVFKPEFLRDSGQGLLLVAYVLERAKEPRMPTSIERIVEHEERCVDHSPGDVAPEAALWLDAVLESPACG